MQISIATANFYFLPFQQTLEIIAEAGFESIELDLYWERGRWAVAQHLKGMTAREVIDLINRAGLKVSSIHDAGGVLENAHSIQGFINLRLKEYVERLGYAPGCIVFHTPHIEGSFNERWWLTIADEIAAAAESYQNGGISVTLENMPFFDGYYVPLTAPQDLLAFVSRSRLGVTLDTTHYAQIGVDVVQAAGILRDKLKTIHLSDFAAGQAHVFIGAGDLDFAGLFRVLDLSALHSITLECSVGFPDEEPRAVPHTEIVERLKLALSRLQNWQKAA